MTQAGSGAPSGAANGPVDESNPSFSGLAGRADARLPGQPGPGAGRGEPQARLRRSRFSIVWLIPLVAFGIAVYLGVQALNNRGPLITLSFKTADGLTAGQTQVRHKAVPLGTVEDIALNRDLSAVEVRVRLNAQGARIVTDRTRFWVVRPRFNAGNISGLETLVSGAFIAVDPGEPGGKPQTSFTGLEQPPGVQSDQPGRTYTLRASNIGSLNEGTPVYYRDIPVGEVLGYDIGDGHGPVTVSIFVRDPYDKFVHSETRFWNSSGLTVGLGANGLHVEVQSLQAIISGAVTYDTPQEAWATPAAADKTRFPLYPDKVQAEGAGYRERIPVVTYLTSSVAGLAAGAAVDVFGIQVGNVTEVKLLLDPQTAQVRVRVAMEIQPERVFPDTKFPGANPQHVLSGLVGEGMRAVVESANFVTGQKDVSLQFVPNAKPAGIAMEGNAIVLPSQAGGLDSVMTSVSDIAAKLGAIPFDQIGQNANALIATLNGTVGGPELKQTLRSVAATMADVQGLVRSTKTDLDPTLRRLPELASTLQATLAHANDVLASARGGYGENSQFQRNLERLMDQANDAVRSVRLLADYLTRNPRALSLGRTAGAGNR